MDRRPLVPEARPRYTVTRLLEPEPPALARRDGGPWTRGGAAFLAVLLFTGISTALPGGVSEAALPEAPPDKSARVTLTEGEWLTIVGSGTPAEALPPGWSLEPGAPDALPDALRPAGEMPWAPPEPLQWILDTSSRAASLARLAEAGGETRLMSRYAPPWLWASLDVAEAPRTRLAVTLPPALDGHSHHEGDAAWVDGVSYYDPVGVGLPLLRVRGFEASPVSAHFTVADFATRDGAPYARISTDLVTGLERMRSLLGPLTVISGYRHPQYNALPSVGGARYSRHQAGQAADVWSPTRSSLEIAVSAIQAMGCGIGLGLGRNTVHVDVRGYLKTWTYPGAPLGDGAFHRWILALCGGEAPGPPPLEARPYDASWAAALDEEELIHLDDEAVEEAVAEAEADASEAIPVARPAMSVVVRRDLGAYAAAAHARSGPGVVVVDLRDGAYVTGEDLLVRSRYVGAATPEALLLRVKPLIEVVAQRPEGAYFVYAIRLPGGRVETGVAPTAALPEAARPTPAPLPPPTASETAVPAPSAEGSWLVRVASRASLAGAEADLQRYAPSLRDLGLRPVLRIQRRDEAVAYEVVVGPFTTADEADEARERVDPLVPVSPDVVRLGP